MTFLTQKKTFLSKKDKSKKGSIDKQILKLINIINKNNNYYTTSSCSGRIVLLKTDYKKKHLSNWIISSHEIVKLNDLKDYLDNIPKDKVWFKMEPFILHIRAKTIENASDLLNLARSIGLKHSGINSVGRKIILEITGNQHLETIISDNNKFLITKDYLKLLIKEANKKLKENFKKIKKFESILQ